MGPRKADSSCLQATVRRLFRTKHLDTASLTQTELRRCLNTLDLTALGIGSTLGAGIYVVAGQVAKDVAGPAVILSFLIAAIASIFAGLCYAEFGSRVPKSGSAYVYSYVTVGELWAFVIGWNLLLEYVIGTASVARAFSNYFDSLVNDAISKYFREHMPINVNQLSQYPDFFAFGITILLTLVLCFGVKESSILNNIFTACNLLVVTYAVVCGLFKVNFHNWQIPANEVPHNATINGHGGFFPFGVNGMLSGAATCFYAFVGFDVIATTAEEVKNPQKAIPVAIVASLLSCFLAYFGVSSILTLVVPYYELDGEAPLPNIFKSVGWPVAQYVIAIGAICGLSTSLLGGMFPMPRVIYAMAQDGVIFRFLAWVPERFKTPVIATLVSGTFAGLGAMLFNLKELVDMMSIGTLLAYTLVAACVLLLRYRPNPFQRKGSVQSINLGRVEPDSSEANSESSQLLTHDGVSVLERLFAPSDEFATERTQSLVNKCVGAESILMILSSVLLYFADVNVVSGDWWAVLILAALVLGIVVIIVILLRQPQARVSLAFKVPCVPVVASLSMFINIYLMMKLNVMTWIRFAIWLAIGFVIYFTYGMWNSNEELKQRAEAEERENKDLSDQSYKTIDAQD